MSLVVIVAASAAERAECRAIRERVFVKEQGVPRQLEVDGLDDDCSHFLAYRAGMAIATARTRHTSRGLKLERVAVLRENRGRAAGRTLVAHVLSQVPAGATVYIHAQQSALGFWERAGFVAEGAPFEEAGIVHRFMLFRG
jgi:predicted GNAT family N-acyltransferase